MPAPSSPAFWRLLSSLALVLAIAGLIFGSPVGWFALIASGVFFGVELLLARRA